MLEKQQTKCLKHLQYRSLYNSYINSKQRLSMLNWIALLYEGQTGFASNYTSNQNWQRGGMGERYVLDMQRNEIFRFLPGLETDVSPCRRSSAGVNTSFWTDNRTAAFPPLVVAIF